MYNVMYFQRASHQPVQMKNYSKPNNNHTAAIQQKHRQQIASLTNIAQQAMEAYSKGQPIHKPKSFMKKDKPLVPRFSDSKNQNQTVNTLTVVSNEVSDDIPLDLLEIMVPNHDDSLPPLERILSPLSCSSSSSLSSLLSAYQNDD
jgi:hypothetical protein